MEISGPVVSVKYPSMPIAVRYFLEHFLGGPSSSFDNNRYDAGKFPQTPLVIFRSKSSSLIMHSIRNGWDKVKPPSGIQDMSTPRYELNVPSSVKLNFSEP